MTLDSSKRYLKPNSVPIAQTPDIKTFVENDWHCSTPSLCSSKEHQAQAWESNNPLEADQVRKLEL